MTAPAHLVDLFQLPFQPTKLRAATHEECTTQLAAGKHISNATSVEIPHGQEIRNSEDAVMWAAAHHSSNALCDHLSAMRATNPGYKLLRSFMPTRTPTPIRRYQQEGAPRRTTGFYDAVANFATPLAPGQVLFHGGAWMPNAARTQLQFPLSTSFCPAMALRNAAWNGKAWHSGYVNLLHIRVSSTNVRGFVCGPRSEKAYELEVILAQETLLMALDATEIGTICVGSTFGDSKKIPVYLVHVVAI